MFFDLLIRNGRVVSAEATRPFDVAISNGQVEALLPPGAAAEAAAVVDASGMVLLPGLVDAHVHLREPGLIHKEGFASGTRAAAAGGVTTVMVMPTDNPPTLTAENFIAKRELAEGQAHVDFALQAGLGTDTSSIRDLLNLGAISFELFLADAAAELLVADAESLLEVLACAAAEGALVGVTPGDNDVVSRRTARIKATATGRAEEFPPTRPAISETLGVARACLAAQETGARVHLRQISARAATNVLRSLRSLAGITSEVTPHNLILDEFELFRQGPFAKVAPPLRPRFDVDGVRDALRERVIDIVVTDHAPHLRSEKLVGFDNIWAAPGGLPGLQTMLPAMLSLVEAGIISINDLVRVCCSAPARIFGLAGRKGSIETGADADIVILDPDTTTVIRSLDQYSKAETTPFEGLTCRGALRQVFLRGVEIVSDGKVTGSAAGRFVAP